MKLLKISMREYEESLHLLQIELTKLQRHFIECGDKILIIFEGRDASGKDGTIKRIIQHLSPRETRVVALGKPSDRERGSWYFQRYVSHLPASQELVLFNRSWYNRAGVEHVMGFCTDSEYEEFMNSVSEFEHMLVHAGIRLFKYYLDISKEEQEKRLADRRKDPLKQWKISAIDEEALKHWKAYSSARNEMFARTHNVTAPWTVVKADDKQLARVSVIKDILTRLHYKGKDEAITLPNPDIVFGYHDDCIRHGLISK
ncbi:MAG: polyphosphate kinase 2 [Burkholderiales bacterium]|nr:polyphosphate kinase 2 [Burkholderiales bacterium]